MEEIQCKVINSEVAQKLLLDLGIYPDKKGKDGFDDYMKFYVAGLEAERSAGKVEY